MAGQPPGSSYSNFVIPKGSKAIPILQPDHTIPEPFQKLAIALPTPPASRTGSSIPSSSVTRGSAVSAGHSAEKEKNDWEFDVYAKPFVPQSLKIINHQPGTPIYTESYRVINFAAFVNTFAGSALLPPRPPVPLHNLHNVLLATTGKSISRDYLFVDWDFEDHLFAEIQAKHQENDDYALYKVPLKVDQPHGLIPLYVPGLREEAPMVEVGDYVQLRQLRLDYQGNPAWMDFWLAPGGGKGRPCPGWTGVPYNACVFSMNRAQEMLFLKVDGLQPESMVFNVLFQVQPQRIQALRVAMAMAHEYMFLPPLNTGQDVARGTAIEPGPEDKFGTETKIPPKKDWMRRMLFPSRSHAVLQKTLHRIPFRRMLFDTRLNFEQLKAVDTICKCKYGTLPFLISGPPGTGKTKTLVETAMQLLASTKVNHILVCAPSDPAADTLALRLAEHFKPDQLLRLNGPSRSFPEVPEPLMPYCYIEYDMFYIPPMPTLMKYDVVVTTCRDAAILVNGRVTNHDLNSLETGLQSAIHPRSFLDRKWEPHWGALLMDEAAQAIEPEALIPLTVIAPPPTANLAFEPQFVMAGDHKQLGPRTASKSPFIETSLFERLFARPLFAEHPLARNNVSPSTPSPVLTKAMLPIIRPSFANLTRNYRSHPAILSIPSSLFYHDTLIPEATETESLLSWNGWRGRKWPVLFSCNAGLDEIERDGGGWYNKLEARMACDYALELYKTGLVIQKDICIMSPFSSQVRQLRALIREPPYQLWEVNIGPTEAFQGLESRVVILCTTRTRTRFLTSDASRALGLVNMPKRMNVALTRAKHGLIVIGHPEVLTQDENWTAFLAFCARNGLWQYQAGTGGEESLKAQQAWLESLKTKGVIGELEQQLLRREEGGEDNNSGRGRVLGGKSRVGGEEMYDGEGEEMAMEEDYNDEDEKDEDGDDHEEEGAQEGGRIEREDEWK